jgi:hypothetical protein
MNGAFGGLRRPYRRPFRNVNVILENWGGCGNIIAMGKVEKRTSQANKTLGGYRFDGRAKDGVWIIRPSLKPDHFSRAEAAASVAKVLRETQGGRLVERSAKKPQ